MLSIAVFMKQVSTSSHGPATDPLTFGEIHDYIGRKYSGAGMRKLRDAEGKVLSTGMMHPQLRVAVNVPARFSERELGRTLELYARQTALEEGVRFEVNVLLNGPAGTDLEDSPAFDDAFEMLESGRVPMSVHSLTYPAQERQIGRMRRDLGALTMRRALEGGHDDPGEIVLVTNDADAHDIAPTYISAIAAEFAADPGLAGATGFIDLPREDFENDHVLLAAHRVSQMLEIIYRAKHPLRPMTMRGGSSAFRLRDYVRAGGHGSARISENRHLNLTLNRTPGLHLTVLPRSLTTIVTDARRQITTMATGKPVSAAYANFGLPGDVAELYHEGEQPAHAPVSPSAGSAEYVQAVTVQLQAMVDKFIHLHETVQWDTVSGWFRRAAWFAGMRIEFDADRKVRVTNADVLIANILTRYAQPVRPGEKKPQAGLPEDSTKSIHA